MRCSAWSPTRPRCSYALPGDPATLPERVLRALLTAWDDPEGGARLVLLVRAAVQEPELARLLRDLLEREIIGRIADHVGGPGRARGPGRPAPSSPG